MNKKLTGLEKLEDRIVLAGPQELLQLADADNVSIASGDWNDVAIWSDGIPEATDDVYIQSDHAVTVDGDASADVIRIDGQLLWQTDLDATLDVDTILVAVGGMYVDQTTTNDHTVVFRDDGPIDTTWDKMVVSRGLVSQGTVTIEGAAKDAFVLIENGCDPVAGSTVLTFAEAPVGWNIGDRLLIPGVVKPTATVDQDEIITIAAINGRTVTLSEPLEYDHARPRFGIDYPIANLDRNITFKSANTSDPTRFGHTMFMTTDTSLSYLGMSHVGRNDKNIATTDPELDSNGDLIPETGTNPRGRYAIHFHRLGYHTQVEVVGSVVEHNRGWGFVNHGSNVLFRDNVSYDIKGAGFVSEDGNELGAFEHNMAVRSNGKLYSSLGGSDKASNDMLGSEGHGFWMQSPGVELVNNFASGHAQEAIFLHGQQTTTNQITGEKTWFPLDQIPETYNLPSGPPRYFSPDGTGITPAKVPFFGVSGNQMFASGKGLGTLWHRNEGLPEADGSNGNVISDTTIWGTTWGPTTLAYVGGLRFDGFTAIGDINNPVDSAGIATNVVARDSGFVLNNLDIEGFTVGVKVLNNSDTYITNAWMRNVVDVLVQSAQATQSTDDSRTVVLSGISHLGLSPAALDGREHFDVQLVKNLDHRAGVGGKADLKMRAMLALDTITLNGRQLYYHDQAADAVPFAMDDAPAFMIDDPVYSQYIDKTQQELWDSYGVALGGAVAPPTATDQAFDDYDALVDYGSWH